MVFFCWAVIVLLMAIGFWGCFVNKVPGPVFVVLAMLVAMFGCDVNFGWDSIAVVTGLAVGSIVLSKVLVKYVKKMHEFSRRASIGTTIGSLLGLLLCVGVSSVQNAFLVILLVLLFLIGIPFILAFLLELTNKKGATEALLSAGAATCAYLADTCLKLIVFCYAIYAMFAINLS